MIVLLLLGYSKNIYIKNIIYIQKETYQSSSLMRK